METAGVMFILLTETEADLQDLSLFRLNDQESDWQKGKSYKHAHLNYFLNRQRGEEEQRTASRSKHGEIMSHNHREAAGTEHIKKRADPRQSGREMVRVKVAV